MLISFWHDIQKSDTQNACVTITNSGLTVETLNNFTTADITKRTKRKSLFNHNKSRKREAGHHQQK